jgi:hypothetical protein
MRTHVDVVIVGGGQAGLSVGGKLKLAPELWENLAVTTERSRICEVGR